jgi:DNA modification methylase
MKIHCSYDRLVPIHELKPHPKNRNTHPDDQIERLAKILDYQGWRYPIKVSNQSGFITSGHGRLLAAKVLGLSEVPVNFQDYEDETQETADLTSDNAIALWAELDFSGINADIPDLGPDFDIDLLGLKDFVLEPIEKLDPQCDEDEVPDVLPEPKVVQGEVYILGNHRLMCGDSTAITDVERLMDGKKADMVYTDPPYGVREQGNRKQKGRDNAAETYDFRDIIGDESEKTAQDAFQTAITIGKTVVYWGANNYSFLPVSRGWLVWDKRENKGQDDNGDAELAWTNINKPIRVFYHLWKGMIKASEHGNRRIHPTQKPIALAEWCFENYGEPNNVLDLFGGSGSTLIACEKTNRHCFMMELDPHYCGVILDRWQKFTGKKAHREDGVAWDEIKAQ